MTRSQGKMAPQKMAEIERGYELLGNVQELTRQFETAVNEPHPDSAKCLDILIRLQEVFYLLEAEGLMGGGFQQTTKDC